MEKIYLNVPSDKRDEYLDLYQAFGYILLTERPSDSKHTQLSFMRNINNPLKKSLRILQKRYFKAKKLAELRLSLTVFFFALLSGGIGTLFLFLRYLIPDLNEIIYHPAFYIGFYALSGILLITSIVLFFMHFNYKKDLPFLIHSIKEDGYELLHIRKRIPKDEYIDKKGIHYHYIHDYYQN